MRASSSSPNCVLVCSGSSSRLAAARHISRSRLGFTRCGRLRPARQQRGRKPLEHVGLLILVQPAGDAAPENPPLDFVLHLIRELQARRIDAPRLLDAEIVARESEAGTQAEAAQIQPAQLHARRCACGRRPVPACCRRACGSPTSGQEFRPSASACSSFAGSCSGVERVFDERRRDQRFGRGQRFVADHRRRPRRASAPPPLCAARTATASDARSLSNPPRFRACRPRSASRPASPAPAARPLCRNAARRSAARADAARHPRSARKLDHIARPVLRARARTVQPERHRLVRDQLQIPADRSRASSLLRRRAAPGTSSAAAPRRRRAR